MTRPPGFRKYFRENPQSPGTIAAIARGPGIVFSALLLTAGQMAFSSPLRTVPGNLTVRGRIICTDHQPCRNPVLLVWEVAGLSREFLVSPSGDFTLDVDLPATAEMTGTDIPDGVATPRGRWDSGGQKALNHGALQIRTCLLQAIVAGRQAASVPLVFESSRRFIDVGQIIVDDSTPAIEGATVRASLLRVPHEALASFRTASRLMDSSQPDDSRVGRLLNRALQECPKFADAWCLLGVLKWRRGNRREARRDLETAARLDDGYAWPNTLLAQMDNEDGDWEKAFERAGTATRIDPDSASAAYLQALSAYHLGLFAVAAASCRRVRLRAGTPEFPDLDLLDAMIHANRGESAAAAPLFRRYLRSNPDTPNSRTITTWLAANDPETSRP